MGQREPCRKILLLFSSFILLVTVEKTVELSVLLLKNGCVLSPLFGLFILLYRPIEQVLSERVHQDSLVFPQDQFGNEGTDSLVRQVLQDIDLFIEARGCPYVVIVLELSAAPPDPFTIDEATAAVLENLGPQVLQEAIIELAALGQSRLKALIRFFTVGYGGFTFIRQRCSRVNTLDQ